MIGILSLNLKNKDNLNVHLLKGLLIDGVPKNLKGTIFPFRYNNFEELENIVKNNNIGTIKMEVKREVEQQGLSSKNQKAL